MTRRLLRLTPGAATLATLAVAAWRYRWMSDDGFIVLRVVRQVTVGNGPVFNPGERVEAVTSPMWLWTLAVADLVLPVRLEILAVVLGMGATLSGVGLAMLAAARLADHRAPGGTRPVLVPAGAALLLGLPPFWKFASGGLENGVVTLWIGATAAVLARWACEGRSLPLRWAPLLGLGPLLRPELTVASIGMLAVVVVGDARHLTGRRLAGLLAGAAALPVAYQVFRMGYYAGLVPNPAYAKEATRSWWSQGWRYLRETVDPYRLWVPLGLLAAAVYPPVLAAQWRARAGRRIAVALTYVAAGLGVGAYVVRVGGDFMQARLLLPALMMLCTPVMVVPLRRPTVAALGVVAWAVVSMAALRAPHGLDAPTTFGPEDRGKVTLAAFGWGPDGPRRAFFDGHGLYWLDRKLPVPPRPGGPDPAVVQYGVGIPAYALGPDTYVLDALGLADPVTARLELGPGRGIVAHEKPLLPPWVVARLAATAAGLDDDDFPRPPLFAGMDPDPYREPFARRVALARRALRCPPLRRFTATWQAPLTPARFAANLRAAFTNHRLRIPRHPRDAAARLCAGRTTAFAPLAAHLAPRYGAATRPVPAHPPPPR